MNELPITAAPHIENLIGSALSVASETPEAAENEVPFSSMATISPSGMVEPSSNLETALASRESTVAGPRARIFSSGPG